MSPTETKSKIRPQQSCLKCRERKIKCDRNIPCEACIHRGIESECTYLTSAEDRAHISQAEIIDRLRREVAQLRSQLNQGSSSARRPSPGRRDKVYARKNKPAGFQRASYTGPAPATAAATGIATAGSGSGSGFVFEFASGPGSSGSGSYSRSATGSAEPMEGGGSWAGSSPSSASATTRTNSGTVASPDSTGSENGVGGAGHIQHYAYPGPYGTQIAEVNMATATDGTAMGCYLQDDALHRHADSVSAFAPKIPDSVSMLGLSSQDMHSTPDGGLAGLPSTDVYGSRGIPGYDGEPAHAQSYTHMAPYGHDAGYNHDFHEYTSTSTISRHDSAQIYTQPWGRGHHFPQSQPHTQTQQHPYPHTTPTSASTYNTSSMNMNTYTPANPNSTNYPPLHSYPPASSIPPTQPHAHAHPQPDPHPTESHPHSHAIPSTPSSWKGPDKQALLETLLETITSCDEARVAQVVAVVRNSQTPEEAVSGICRVLGIGGDGGDGDGDDGREGMRG